MNKPAKKELIIAVAVMVVTLIGIGATLFVIRDNRSSEESKQKITLNSSTKKELGAEDAKTAGNWTFIKFDYSQGNFDVSIIPEILDRFEREHPNLSIIDYPEIVYNSFSLSLYPHGILIRHEKK